MSARITEQEALAWRTMYEEEGMTVEGIALEVGRSLTAVQLWLRRVETVMRSPGSSRRGIAANQLKDGVVGKQEAAIPRPYSRGSLRRGHRRRGWK